VLSLAVEQVPTYRIGRIPHCTNGGLKLLLDNLELLGPELDLVFLAHDGFCVSYHAVVERALVLHPTAAGAPSCGRLSRLPTPTAAMSYELLHRCISASLPLKVSHAADINVLRAYVAARLVRADIPQPMRVNRHLIQPAATLHEITALGRRALAASVHPTQLKTLRNPGVAVTQQVTAHASTAHGA
jgi:hypothetical protein